MPPTPPGEQQQTNRFASVTELEPGQEVWVYASGWWRHGRVVKPARTRVAVAFRLARFNTLRKQTVSLNNLRRHQPGTRYAQNTVPAPTLTELGL